ncbi:TPA: hypothetical protein I8Y10_001826 [Kluyvera cryocrescens]|nr:hypothetical protein [Kluyvera cryocrescens]
MSSHDDVRNSVKSNREKDTSGQNNFFDELAKFNIKEFRRSFGEEIKSSDRNAELCPDTFQPPDVTKYSLLSPAAVQYQTKVDLDMVNPGAGVAIVINDSTAENNGYYSFDPSTSVWVKMSYQSAMADDLSKLQKEFDDSFYQSPEKNEIALDITDIDGFSLWKLFLDGSFGTLLAKLTATGISLRDFSITQKDDKLGINYVDADGFYLIIIDEKGVVAPQTLKGYGEYETLCTNEAWLRIKDNDGFYKDIIDVHGRLVASSKTKVYDLLSRDLQNKAYSQNVVKSYNSNIKRLVTAVTHIIVYGQSLSTGYQGYPAITKNPESDYDNLMLGDSPRPNSRQGAAFIPVGGNVLKPLKAVVQTEDGSRVLSDSEVCTLTSDKPNEGEGSVAMVNALRRMWLQSNNLESDASRRFVLSVTGCSGRTIEQLSKGANPEQYQRPVQAAQKVKALADAGKFKYSLGALVWIQGEYNYKASYGGTTDKDEYKKKLAKLYNDLVTDISSKIAGQKENPALFHYQTGGQYTSDDNDLSIGMAQWEFSKENSFAYLATPAYPFTDLGGHLTCNGYRGMDEQFAKVMHRVLNLGQGWEPLSPIKTELIDDMVYISYHVPCPPIKFRPSYIKGISTLYKDKGFRITENGDDITILSVEIVADTIIKLTLSRAPESTIKLWYADATKHKGHGNVFDSDSFQSLYGYVYDTGQNEDENLPELINKPYPLYNASIQFCLEINKELDYGHDN